MRRCVLVNVSLQHTLCKRLSARSTDNFLNESAAGWPRGFFRGDRGPPLQECPVSFGFLFFLKVLATIFIGK